MILVDTDHLSALSFEATARQQRLSTRMADSPDQRFVLPIPAVEEALRGWLASIRHARDSERLQHAYAKLADLLDLLADWNVARFDGAAAARFSELVRLKIRVGTMDLRIASIALANDALLLSANAGDFEKVPGLRVENWLD